MQIHVANTPVLDLYQMLVVCRRRGFGCERPSGSASVGVGSATRRRRLVSDQRPIHTVPPELRQNHESDESHESDK